MNSTFGIRKKESEEESYNYNKPSLERPNSNFCKFSNIK